MKKYIAFAVFGVAIILTGCRTQTSLVDYPQVQKIALAAISQKNPNIKSSDLRIDYIKSELDADGKSIIEVQYKQLSSMKRVKDTARYGQKTLVTFNTEFVRMSNSGKIESLGEGSDMSWE